jgi:hypothetical protein
MPTLWQPRSGGATERGHPSRRTGGLSHRCPQHLSRAPGRCHRERAPERESYSSTRMFRGAQIFFSSFGHTVTVTSPR